MIKDKRINQGRHWGVAPFGCDRNETGQLVPSERTYTVDGEERYYHDGLSECFRLYATGNYSYEQAADTLNAAGHRFWDRKGNPSPWTEDRVRGVVNRWRIYAGDLPLGDPRKDPEVKWLEGGHAPIMPVELCETVGVILSKRGKRGHNRAGYHKRTYLLSDILYCHCGTALNGQYYNGHRRYRHKLARGKCQETWIDADSLEAEVIKAIVQLVDHPTLRDGIKQLLEATTNPDIDYQDQIDDARKRLERLEDLYLTEGGIGKESYLARRQAIITELDKYRGKQAQPSTADVVDEVLSALKSIAIAEPEIQKALINEIFERLEAKGGQIHRAKPQEWAEPFFSLCCKWAEWEFSPDSTETILTRWLTPHPIRLTYST